tara:strand:- start:89 stop:361 length:273 start_codon:yes stop_codon:yes gene_type:complete
MNSIYVNNWFSAEKTTQGFVFSMKAAGKKDIYHKCFLTQEMMENFSKWCELQIGAAPTTKIDEEPITDYPEKWDSGVLEEKARVSLKNKK